MLAIEKLKPKGYFLAICAVSIGGFLNGYDTGSIGAITVMPQFLNTFGDLSPFMRGFSVSLLLLMGTAPSLFAGYLSDTYGRLSITGLGASIFLVGVVLEGAASKLPMFLVGRSLAGIGEGFWLGCVTVYAAEVAPATNRGLFMSIVQLNTTFGITLGYFTCYGTVRLPSSLSWRLPFIIQAILATALIIACYFLPSSPRWLVLHGRRDEALQAVERLGIDKREAEKDILNPTGVEHEQLERGYWHGLVMLFRKTYRKRTGLALLMLGGAQLSGIDGVLYYAPTLFEQAGLPEQTAGFLASGVSAILMMAITVPAVLLADKIPRRTSVISGGLILTACMFLMGILYASSSVHQGYGVARWVVVTSIFVFALTYCFTWAVVMKIYASEIQPAKTRASANSIAQGMGFFTNWVVAFTTPIFLASSRSGVYFFYGGLTLFNLAVMACYMPETKGVPLEEVHRAFNEPVFKGWNSLLRRRVVEPLSRPASRAGLRNSGERGEEIEMGSFAKATGSGGGLRVQVGGSV